MLEPLEQISSSTYFDFFAMHLQNNNDATTFANYRSVASSGPLLRVSDTRRIQLERILPKALQGPR